MAYLEMCRKPPNIPDLDSPNGRFSHILKKRKYICDSCDREVAYNIGSVPFLGNYILRNWGDGVSPDQLKAGYLSGTYDATWWWLDCITLYLGYDDDRARAATEYGIFRNVPRRDAQYRKRANQHLSLIHI